MNGDCVEYYESGKIREKLTFKNGLPVGEKIVYSERGEIIEKESL
jgi:antitoxin component YwqK of YwqJK toxin-antitoxin module